MKTTDGSIYSRYKPVTVFMGAIFVLIALMIFLSPPLRASLFGKEADASLKILTNYYLIGITLTGVVLLLGGLAHGRGRSAGEAAAMGADEYEYSPADLFLISFLILFLELALIRWVPAYTRLLSYFSNFILLACFLGMGVGCLLSRRKSSLVDYLPPSILLLVVYTLSMYLLNMHGLAANKIWGRAGDREMIMGNALMDVPLLSFIPIELHLVIIFTLAAVIFMGLGQTLGRAMDKMPPLKAYSINIFGSLSGILVFTVIAFLSIPAPAWFLVAFVLLFWFFLKPYSGHRLFKAGILASAFVFIFFFSLNAGKHHTFWSPYYKIRMVDDWPNSQTVVVNEIGHQVTLPLDSARHSNHAVPFLVYKNATGAPPEDVLIIGSGTGNDIVMATSVNAKNISAVEIDPTIKHIGTDINPLRPYRHESVKAYVNDGRAFFKSYPGKYDMVTFSVLDSLTLFSTYSSVHLESFLFTEESFREVKEHLKPGGVFVFYTYCRQHWLSTRTYQMMRDVFDGDVVLLTVPYEPVLDYRQDMTPKLMIYLAGGIGPIREAFDKQGQYTIYEGPLEKNLGVNGFELEPEDEEGTLRIGITEVIPDPDFIMPTDDWPFFYMRHSKLSFHDYRGLAVILVLSLLFILAPLKGDVRKFSPHFFFLGGAFMLLEVSSITRMALLYGTTWIVNSIVFFAILLMAFFANLYVLKIGAPRKWILYSALFAALVLNYAIPIAVFLDMSGTAKHLLSNGLMFLPIVFSGMIFSTSFSGSNEPAAHFGSNLLGIIIGGLAVYLAVWTGYRNLLLVVLLLYVLSLVFSKRK